MTLAQLSALFAGEIEQRTPRRPVREMSMADWMRQVTAE